MQVSCAVFIKLQSGVDVDITEIAYILKSMPLTKNYFKPLIFLIFTGFKFYRYYEANNNL